MDIGPLKHDNLLKMHQDMTENPDDLQKQVAYYKALADARLDDYYRLSDAQKSAEQKLALICQLSDVGDLFDGHDELNEYTIQANNKLLEQALDNIHDLLTGKTTVNDW